MKEYKRQIAISLVVDNVLTRLRFEHKEKIEQMLKPISNYTLNETQRLVDAADRAERNAKQQYHPTQQDLNDLADHAAQRYEERKNANERKETDI